MRSLLGTLRDIETSGEEPARDPGVEKSPAAHRGPEPTLADLPDLVAARDSGGLRTAYRLVESHDGAHANVAPRIGLTLYRVAQEALANVTRHSTATVADVVTRVVDDGPGRAYAEVEIVDNGRPRAGTSGSGLGQARHEGAGRLAPRHGRDRAPTDRWLPCEGASSTGGERCPSLTCPRRKPRSGCSSSTTSIS